MVNVGFINPPSEFLIKQRMFMSLGILRVATHLSKLDRYNVHFLDLTDVTGYYGSISSFITRNALDVVCFTATTPQISIVYEFCKFVKSSFPVKIILGGPHVTLMHASFVKGTGDIKKICWVHTAELLKYINTIVIGDGEYAIVDAIATDETIIDSEQNARLFLGRNYDEVAIPNRQFLDLDSYDYCLDGVKATNIISQMGCPYQCEFCSGRGSKTFNTIRKRSIENIMEEIDMLHTQHNYTGFMFYDDELNINKRYFEQLLQALIHYQKKHGVSLNLRGFTRSDLLTPCQAELMRLAGFKWLLVGFESGSDRILSNVNKGCTVADNSECFKIAADSGLKVKALMSIGHPGESQDTIKETMQWLQEFPPDELDVTIISVYPGSEYFNKSVVLDDNLLKYENIKTNDSLYIKNIDFLNESNFYKSKNGDCKAYVSTDYLSSEQLVEQRSLIVENGKG